MNPAGNDERPPREGRPFHRRYHPPSVGRRPDNSLPGRDEREALGKVVIPVANAIAIARTRARRCAEVADMFKRLEQTLGGFGKRITKLETASKDAPC